MIARIIVHCIIIICDDGGNGNGNGGDDDDDDDVDIDLCRRP